MTIECGINEDNLLNVNVTCQVLDVEVNDSTFITSEYVVGSRYSQHAYLVIVLSNQQVSTFYALAQSLTDNLSTHRQLQVQLEVFEFRLVGEVDSHTGDVAVCCSLHSDVIDATVAERMKCRSTSRSLCIGPFAVYQEVAQPYQVGNVNITIAVDVAASKVGCSFLTIQDDVCQSLHVVGINLILTRNNVTLNILSE